MKITLIDGIGFVTVFSAKCDVQWLCHTVFDRACHIYIKGHLVEFKTTGIARGWAGVGGDISIGSAWVVGQVLGGNGGIDGIAGIKVVAVFTVH